MRVTVEAGADLDIVTPGELRQELDQAFVRHQGKLWRPFSVTGIVPAGGLITLPGVDQAPIGPPPGYEWDISRITLTGTDPTAALAGRVGIYKMEAGPPPGWAGRDPLAFVDFADTIPNTWLGLKQLVLRPGERLVLFGSGINAGEQLIANGLAIESPEVRMER